MDKHETKYEFLGIKTIDLYSKLVKGMNKLKIYKHENKTYISNGIKYWLYDGENIKEINYIPNINIDKEGK